MKLSIIITTYNWLSALQAILRALSAQQHAGEFEVLIADDGSTVEVKNWLQQQTFPFPLIHVWQPDEGFRAAKIRNQAIAKASGQYIVFIDGDCIPPNHFIQRHRALAEKDCFVSGNRVLLQQEFTSQVLAQQLPIHQWGFGQWWLAALRKQVNRCLPFLPLPKLFTYHQYSSAWQGAKTCNLAVWREHLLAINGFDERYQGWGYEDSDLVIRLQRLKVRRKLGRFVTPVLHLWHRENDRSQEASNLHFLQSILHDNRVVAELGIDQYGVFPTSFRQAPPHGLSAGMPGSRL